MKLPHTAALLYFTCAFAAAHATVTTTVVDVPVAGATQRFLYVKPEAPVANIVSIAGGDGILGIQPDGTMTTIVAACNPVARVRLGLAERGYAVALVDANSNGAARDPDGTLEVIRHMRARHDVPTWIVGGSAGTATVTALATTMPDDIPGGVIYNAPARPNSRVESIRRPTLVVYHVNDTDQFGAAMFNALTSAPVRERAALSGGSNAGCGYHLFNGLDATYLDRVAGFIDKYNGLTMQARARNYQGLWWNAPGGSESGWGVNLTHQADTLFATWFTYDTDGRGLWLVMSDGARIAENTYSGPLYRTTGPPFNAVPFNPSRVTATEVGTATFTFADETNGTFAYAVNGVSQSKAITRQAYSAPVPTCAAGGTHGSPPNYQALWWNSPAGSESGWGVNIVHQGDILFATWFTYDVDGRGMWLVMSNGARTGPGAYSGALYRTTGPAFSASPWSPASVGITEVGMGAFAFSDADTGTFTYTVGGVTQSKPITRLVYASPVTVCR